MKRILFVLSLLVCLSAACAQDADPLAVTLPNGKIVHFPNAEQKAKFEAAQQRKLQMAAATPTPPPIHHAQLGSALDAPAQSGTGLVNTSAPPFTANYYVIAPATWVGKSITLAVAYVTADNEGARADGLVQLTANTWNNSVVYGGDQSPGGNLVILATPAEAVRIMQQCGTTMQWMGYARLKVTMIKGQMTALADQRNVTRYGLMVGK